MKICSEHQSHTPLPIPLVFNSYWNNLMLLLMSLRPRTLKDSTKSTFLSEDDTILLTQARNGLPRKLSLSFGNFLKEWSQMNCSKIKGIISSNQLLASSRCIPESVKHLVLSTVSGVTLLEFEKRFYLVVIGWHLFNSSWPQFVHLYIGNIIIMSHIS